MASVSYSKEHISQIYNCAEITTPCELFYVCELGKYLAIDFCRQLSLDGVIIADNLKNSYAYTVFRIAVTLGYIVNYGDEGSVKKIDESEVFELNTAQFVNDYYYFVKNNQNFYDCPKTVADLLVPKHKQVSIDTKTEEGKWIWSLAGEDGVHYSINRDAVLITKHSHQNLISLIAKVAISRFVSDGTPKELVLLLDRDMLIKPYCTGYIDILQETTVAIPWVSYIPKSCDTDRWKQNSYYSWYLKGADDGVVGKSYSVQAKKQHIDDLDIKVGDLVLFYKRKSMQQANFLKEIDSFKIARYDGLKGRDRIKFTTINTTKTRYTAKHDYDENTMIVKAMYADKLPYENLNVTQEDLDIRDVGIEYYMLGEEYFILPITDGKDFCYNIFVGDISREYKLWMEWKDLTYWILEDYGFPYNKQRFLDKCFVDREPLYEQFQNGSNLEDWWMEAID